MPRPSSLARWSTATSLLLLLLPPAAAAEPDVDAIDARLAYAEDPSRLDLLGDLTVGSTPVTSVCLCTDRQPGKEECVELADACARPGGPERQALPAALANGHQGYFYEGLKPAMVAASGDTLDVELVAAGVNAYDEQVTGDPALEALFAWDEDGPAIRTMGALGGGEGNHWLSGPIWVCDAEPGDVLQVDVLELKPRPNPGKDGRAFGWTGSPWWGVPWGPAGFKTGKPREIVTVMELKLDEEGRATEAVPLYSYNFASLNVTTPCALAEDDFPCTTEAGAAAWDNTKRVYGNAQRLHGNASQPYTVPCVDGQQAWDHLVYVGWPFEVPEDQRDYSVAGRWRAPANLHIGIMGLAPAVGVPVSSAAPMRTGGNMDQLRLTKGASLYLPVEVYGALLSMGDGHGAMGSGEIAGTGVETSLNARVRVTLHKADSLPKPLKGLSGPLLENKDEWVVQGFSFSDYLRDLEDPQATVGKESTLDRAFQVAFNETRGFLMGGFGLSEDEALQVMSLAVDFGVTQMVDANLGVHAVIPKFALNTSLPAPAGRN